LVCLLAMTAFFFAGGHMWLTWVECGFVGLDFESYCSLCQSIVLGFIALDYLATWLITHGAGLQTLRRSLFWKIVLFQVHGFICELLDNFETCTWKGHH
jgi:hypothetical protein